MRNYPLALMLLLTACGIGPPRLSNDRISYNEAIAESWKSQMLLNIVKLRYMDAPVFLDVQQILAGYSLESSGTAGWSENGLASGWSVGGHGRFTDRPTITFRPVSGAEFAKSFMTPIPPSAIFFLIQAGFSADFVLPLCVQSINGLRNGSGTKSQGGAPDDRFVRLINAMTKTQGAGALGMRVEKGTARSSTVLFFPSEGLDEETTAAVEEIGDLLRLEKGRREFKVEYSTAPGGKDTIVMLTRSALTIMFELAVQIDVPEEHATKHYCVPSPPIDESIRLIRVHTGASDPGKDAFVKVKHTGYWFWIRRDDIPSKRVFSFTRLLFGFVDKGEPPPPTLVTVPAG